MREEGEREERMGIEKGEGVVVAVGGSSNGGDRQSCGG